MAELNINADEANLNDAEHENRHVSNNTESVSQYFAALLADAALTAEQRRALAQARMGLFSDATREQIESSLATLPTDSPAQHYKVTSRQPPVSMRVIMPAPNGISLSSLKAIARGWRRPRNTC